MKRILIASAVLLSTGCGSSATPAEPTTPIEEVEVGPSEEELASIREERARQDAELRRLRGQLAMAQAEAELSQGPPPISETVTIGDSDSSHDDLFDDDLSWQVESEPEPAPERASVPDESGPRLVLRLYGTPANSELPSMPSTPRAVPDAAPIATGQLPSTAPPVVFPAPPPGVSMQLPTTSAGVASLPLAPAPPTTTVSTAPLAAPDPATEEYRAALSLVRDRRSDAALTALARFVERHPGHAFADDALYWRGEVLYMQRHYRRAVEQYEIVVARHRRGNKAADAMLKIGLCLRHMGETERADSYFERLRTQYPNSVAARMSSREDAS